MNIYLIPNNGETYNEYINRILNSRPNIKDKNYYQEKHHIVPRCKQGSNDKSNLIYLYPMEHYYAHKLLALENPEDIQLARAWWLISHMKTEYNDFYDLTPQQYEEARTHFYKKLSEIQKGRQMPEECIKALQNVLERVKVPVRCVETGIEYSSYSEASAALGQPSNGNVRLAALGLRETCCGYHWEIIGDNDELRQISKQNRERLDASKYYKPIYCYELDKVFNNCREACKELNLEYRNLSAVLYGMRHSVNGYSFDFISPTEEEKTRIEKNKAKKAEGKHKNSRSKILCVETGEIFNSQTEAGEKNNIKPQRISDVVNGYSKTAGGYHWQKI